MKKIISILSLICIFTLCLASCASLETYEENLGSDYDIEIASDDEIDELAKEFGVKADDYGISAVMYAKKTQGGYYAYVIQCESSGAAEELVEDLAYVVGIMDAAYSFDVEAVADGKFVLVGNADVVAAAMGE